MKRSATKVVGIACFALSGSALSFTPPQSLLNVCDVPAPLAVPDKVLDATAFLVPVNRISQNPDLTYEILTEPFTSVPALGGGQIPVCPHALFYNETSAVGGRTGVLIAPDIIMTAPHTNEFNPQQFVVVFRTRVQDQPTSSCSNFEWSSIHPDNVYFPSSSSPIANTYGQTGNFDYAAFRLDRPVAGRKPLKIRRSGQPNAGAEVIMTGFPYRTGMKVDLGGVVVDLPSTPDLGLSLFNLHPFAGSSGSPIYNALDDVVEAIVSAPISGSSFTDTTATPFCVLQVHSGQSASTNGDIAHVQGEFPRPEVLVSPLTTVIHDVPLAASDLGEYTYTIRAGYSSNQYSLSHSSGMGNGAPSLGTSISPGNHTLSFINPSSLVIAPSVLGVSSCGIWDQHVKIRDLNHEQDNFIRHRFEVGLKTVSLSSSEPFEVQALAGPFNQTKQYMVQNMRPSATSVTIAAIAPVPNTRSQWLKVDGQNSVSVNLGPAGSPTDSYTFTASMISNLASLLPAGEWHSGSIVLQHADAICATHGDLSIPARVRWGTVDYVGLSDGDVVFPPPGNGPTFGAHADVAIDVDAPMGYCVSSLALDFGQLADPNFGVWSLFQQIAPLIQIELIAPSTFSGTLWDRNPLPPDSGNYLANEVLADYHGFVDVQTQVLKLHDLHSPPLGGNLLSHFEGLPASGQWLVRVRRVSGGETVFPTHARLIMSASSAACSQ